MRKYRINKNRILNILRKYDPDLRIDDTALRDETRIWVDFDPALIEDIECNRICVGYKFYINMIIEILHPRFEEKPPRYDYDKCKKFLKGLNYEIDCNALVKCLCFDCSNNEITRYAKLYRIVDRLNGRHVYLTTLEEGIANLLINNKDQLLED